MEVEGLSMMRVAGKDTARKRYGGKKDMAGKKIRLEERYGGKKVQRRFKGGFPAKTMSNKIRSRARQSASTIVKGRGERG